MSAGAQLVEPIVTALVARLNANLPGVIATINADHTDGITVDNPAQVLDYMPPLGLIQTFPTVAVGARRFTFEDDVLWTATGKADLTVVACVTDASQQALVRKQWRYMQALTRAIFTSDGVAATAQLGSAWGIARDFVEYGDAFMDTPPSSAGPPHTLITYSGLGITCRADEN